ncbi:MAG: NnrS family protein, partial [Halieaceae bacterium]|nr:NnrS family protein [Halieaceae bacterium]
MQSVLASNQPVRPPAVRPALLRLAFRPFFLLGSLFSVVSLLLWAAIWAGTIEPAVYGGALWWHMHEMLFGFVCAIVVGFLLTAVQSWTGIPGLKGGKLLGLVLLWLAARVMLFVPAPFPRWLIALVDLSFLPLAALAMASFVARVQQWRNFIFVPVLLAMASVNGVMHWSAWMGEARLQSEAGTVMVLLVSLLMSTMAGRVVPMFTANGTGTPRVADMPRLE